VFPDLDIAYLDAFRAATEMWIEALADGRNPSRQRFEIRDVTGQVLLVLPFSEILESGKGTRRVAPSFAAITETAMRARSLQAEVTTQLDVAWGHLRDAKEALLRLDAVVR